MKYFILISVFVFFYLSPTNAQTWQWSTQAGGAGNEYAAEIDVDDHGNSYVTGRFSDTISFGTYMLTNPGFNSVYIAKYDINGIFIWARIAATGANIFTRDICVDKSGNISITGNYSGSADFGDVNPVNLISSGDFDIYAAKYNSTGDIIWAKSTGGAGFDEGNAICTGINDEIIIIGDLHITSYVNSSSMVRVACFDNTGNTKWMKTTLSYGYFFHGNDISTDSSGNAYFTGQFFNYFTFDSTIILDAGNVEDNIFIGKFDSSGNIQWLQKAGAASGYAGGIAIVADKKGNSYITGFYRGLIYFGGLTLSGPTTISYDPFITKCDKDGNFVWVNQAAGPGTIDQGSGISLDDSGNCYIAGHFTDTFTIGSTTLMNTGIKDVFITKADSSGNFIWAVNYGGLLENGFGGIKVKSPNIFVCGSFRDTIHFDSFNTLITDTGSYDIYLAKLSDFSLSADENKKKPNISLFPNPSKNKIELLGLNNPLKYIIYDALGRKVIEELFGETKILNIEKLNSGIYFLSVQTTDNPALLYKLKFIKY